MSRIVFKKGKQREFLASVKHVTGLSFSKIGKLCGNHPRSLSDWYVEKVLISESVANIISNFSGVKLPDIMEIRSDYWSKKQAGSIGGKNNIKLNGNPGTILGRKKGGARSVKVNKIRKTNFIQRKEFDFPEKSCLLAEFFGIMLGDGGITKNQISITLNKNSDADYVKVVEEIIFDLFKIRPSIRIRDNCVVILISGANFTNFLVNGGLEIGNKVKQQVKVPGWIKNNIEFSKACVRGLVDTDGCFYKEKHKVESKIYESLCIDFTNHSIPLLDFVYEVLDKMELRASRYLWKIRLRKKNDVIGYVNNIGASNLKHKNKFLDHFKIGEVV